MLNTGAFITKALCKIELEYLSMQNIFSLIQKDTLIENACWEQTL